MVDRDAVSQGVQQNLSAKVVFGELQDLLGNEMPLRFDLDGWRPAAFGGESVTVYLRGKFRTTAGLEIDAPLLVKFPAGKGNVLFTSFHNEKQNSTLESKLLKHLVFSTVAASIQTTVTQSMVRGGLSLQESNLLQQATLSQTLSERRGQVVAALVGCMLEDAISPALADVVKSLRMGGVSPFDADVAAIGRVLRARAARVALAASRTRSKTHQSKIRVLAKRLHELRFRVSTLCVGSGEAQVVSARVVDPGLRTCSVKPSI